MSAGISAAITVCSAAFAASARRGLAAVAVVAETLVAPRAAVVEGAEVSVDGGASKDGKVGRSRLGPRGGREGGAWVVVVVVGRSAVVGGRVEGVGDVVVVVGLGLVVVVVGGPLVVVGPLAVVFVVGLVDGDGAVVVVGRRVVEVVGRGFWFWFWLPCLVVVVVGRGFWFWLPCLVVVVAGFPVVVVGRRVVEVVGRGFWFWFPCLVVVVVGRGFWFWFPCRVVEVVGFPVVVVDLDVVGVDFAVVVVGRPVVEVVGRGFWFWLPCRVVVVVGLLGAAAVAGAAIAGRLVEAEPLIRTAPASSVAETNRPPALERIGPPQ